MYNYFCLIGQLVPLKEEEFLGENQEGKSYFKLKVTNDFSKSEIIKVFCNNILGEVIQNNATVNSKIMVKGSIHCLEENTIILLAERIMLL